MINESVFTKYKNDSWGCHSDNLRHWLSHFCNHLRSSSLQMNDFRYRFNLLQDQIWRLTIRCTIQLSLSAGSRILLSSRERKLPLSRTINSTIPELSFASSTTWCCRPFPSHGPQRIQRHEQFCMRVIPVHFQRNTRKDNSFRQCQCFHRRDQPVFIPDEKLLIIKKL